MKAAFDKRQVIATFDSNVYLATTLRLVGINDIVVPCNLGLKTFKQFMNPVDLLLE